MLLLLLMIEYENLLRPRKTGRLSGSDCFLWLGRRTAGRNGTKAAAKDQLDRASTSLPLNIAEGNGKFSTVDRARFLEIARGSALECAACLDVLEVRKLVAAERIVPAKEKLVRIVNMLMGMLKRFSGRAKILREDEGHYAIEHEQEHE
jgi:four helix bundle protein